MEQLGLKEIIYHKRFLLWEELVLKLQVYLLQVDKTLDQELIHTNITALLGLNLLVLMEQHKLGGAGTQTAALGVAGETPPGTDLTTSYEYNGSTWTAGNACNVPGYDALVFGTSAGAHMACLTGPPTNLETEEYDGTNWTASATAIRSQNQGGASGTYPIGLIFGGASSAPSTSTQGWDGTAWSTRPSLSTARRAKGSGVTAQALAQGGETPPGSASNATEELGPETTSLNIETLTQS